jgi:U5 small nuclear ribonucleoprotein component
MHFDCYGNFFKTTDSNKSSFRKNSKIKKSINQTIIEKIPKTIYSKRFFFNHLTDENKSIKTVSVTGHFHHGKTSLINCLVKSVHLLNDNLRLKNFTDFFFLEHQRKMTIKGSVFSLLLCDKYGNPFNTNIFDCPGHPDFFDHAISSLKMSDASLIVVDVAEGVLLGTELSIRASISLGIPIVLVINALDRLVIEMRLSPKKIFIRIVEILDDLNFIVEECFVKSKIKSNNIQFFNPVFNNVCFASFLQGWTFTLNQFSEMYISSQPAICLSIQQLVIEIWEKSLFEEFIIYPVCKIMFLNISESVLFVRKFIENELGIFGIKNFELNVNKEKLIFYCMSLFFGGCRSTKLIPNHTGLITGIRENVFISKHIKKISSSKNKNLIDLKFAGLIGKLVESVNQDKLFLTCRLLRGRMCTNEYIYIRSETHENNLGQKTIFKTKIEQLYIPVGRYRINVKTVKANCIFLIKINSKFIIKSGIFASEKNGILYLQNLFNSIMRDAVQMRLFPIFFIEIDLLKNENLDNIAGSLKKCSRLYPLLQCKMIGKKKILLGASGRLYLDSVLYDLMNYFNNFDVKFSSIYILKRESLVNTFYEKNKFEVKKIFQMIKNDKFISKTYPGFIHKTVNLGLKISRKTQFSLKKAIYSGIITNEFIRNDMISKKDLNSIWKIGPDLEFSRNCIFLSNCNTNSLNKIEKNHIIQGFQWAIKKGPLFNMHVNETEFTLNLKNVKSMNFFRKITFPSQIKRKMHKIFMENKPILQEPMFFFETYLPRINIYQFTRYIFLKKGNIFSINFKYQESIVQIRGSIKAAQCLLFEDDFKKITRGEGLISLFFDRWNFCTTH